MQPPADPGRQLLRLGSGQQVAEVERVEIVLLADPVPLLDQLAVHQRDLPRRPAEAQQADPQEHPEQVGKGWSVGS